MLGLNPQEEWAEAQQRGKFINRRLTNDTRITRRYKNGIVG
ncbi:hypothetical protein PL10110_290061 [Planktothrix agardhii]|nr:hypothetical protein PL10110_290061 [Planktothrix agardhii]